MKKIRLRSYKLLDSQQKPLLVSDFSAPLAVQQGLWSRVAADLAGFTPAQVSPELTSEIGVDVDQQSLTIQRSGGKFTVTPELQPAFVEWWMQQTGSQGPTHNQLVNFVLTGANDKEALLKVLPSMLNAYRSTQDRSGNLESAEAQKIIAEITRLGGEQAKEMLDLHKNILALEMQLAGQRQMDEIQLGSSQVQDEIEVIDEKLVSVDQLAQRQKQIEGILARYAGLLQRDLENEANQLCEEITQLRVQELKQAAAGKDLSVGIPKDDEHKQPRFLVKELLAMAAISTGVGVVAYLVLRDIRPLLIGPLFALCELAVLVVVNMVPAGVAKDIHGGGESPIAAMAEKHDQGRIAALEKFFVDKAWVTALRNELQSQKAAMSERLGGTDYEKLRQLRELVSSQLQVIRREIQSFKSKEIAPEEYLRKRRELDTMKIRKSKIENELSSAEYFGQIQELIQELDDLQVSTPQGSGLGELNEKYVDYISDKGKLLVKRTADTPAEAVDLSVAELQALYGWLTLSAWSKVPVHPLVVVTNYLAQLEQRAQNAINAKISQMREVGQIITVTVQG